VIKNPVSKIIFSLQEQCQKIKKIKFLGGRGRDRGHGRDRRQMKSPTFR